MFDFCIESIPAGCALTKPRKPHDPPILSALSQPYENRSCYYLDNLHEFRARNLYTSAQRWSKPESHEVATPGPSCRPKQA